MYEKGFNFPWTPLIDIVRDAFKCATRRGEKERKNEQARQNGGL